MSADDLTDTTIELLARVRSEQPRVHCLTNTVAESFTANALLALGAVPSMTSDIGELGDFVRSAGALLINLGTPGTQMRSARQTAVEIAADESTPWVLDPVMVNRSPARLKEAAEFIEAGPTVIRCNAAEAAALSLSNGRFGIVLAQTGDADHIRQDTRKAILKTGHPLMARVTATGCALSAIVAAFLAAAPDRPFDATASALAYFGIAGALAARESNGPGSFAAALLDWLYGMDEAILRERLPSVLEMAGKAA